MPDTISNKLSKALTQGLTEWEQVKSELTGPCEIIGVDFKNAALSVRNLRSVNFIGCTFELFNFDDATLADCSFSDITFKHCSFSKTRMSTTTFSNTQLNECTLDSLQVICGSWSKMAFLGGAHSNVFLFDSELSELTFQNLNLESVEFCKCKITNIHLENISSEVTSINECIIDGMILKNSQIDFFGFDNSRLFLSKFKDSTAKRWEVIQSTIKNVKFCRFTPDALEITQSLIESCDLVEISIENAVLSKSTFRECSWPNQVGKTTWYGAYKAAPRLLSHPVRDIEGIELSFRSIIAEQQYLHHLSESTAHRPLRKIAFFLWGVFTDYGRSLSRFGLFCLLAILTFSVLQVSTCLSHNESNATISILSLSEAFSYKAQIFLGFPIPREESIHLCTTAYNFPMRLVGFIAIGLWIGLAANKLGLLSGVRS